MDRTVDYRCSIQIGQGIFEGEGTFELIDHVWHPNPGGRPIRRGSIYRVTVRDLPMLPNPIPPQPRLTVSVADWFSSRTPDTTDEIERMGDTGLRFVITIPRPRPT
jgi:hypothetical protein